MSRQSLRFVLLILAMPLTAICAFAQEKGVSAPARAPVEDRSAEASDLERLDRQLREQREEIERLRAMLMEQARLIEELRLRLEDRVAGRDKMVEPTGARLEGDRSATGRVDDRIGGEAKVEGSLARVEKRAGEAGEAAQKQFGSISFSGDLRLRYESFYGQVNALPNASNPSIVGNDLTSRQRFRVRARLAIRGSIGRDLAWGLRLATGSYADDISTNQTLTDFFNRKPFSLDQAFVAWTPKRVPGLRLQGGKFEAPWLHTEMTFDDDLQFEGFSQSYARDFKVGALRNLTLVAWQLPFLERNAAFILDQNGKLLADESRRAGRDLALFGGQARARFALGDKAALTVSAAEIYFMGTQFITPARFFGSDVQLPVAVKIPANGTTPAQTVTAQLTIPRDWFVSGNANLGLSMATNNAVNRDGRLASGFNLIDLIGKLELTHSRRFPVTLIFNSVINTQAHPVIVAGPNGQDVRLPNGENAGYWAEVQIGKTRERGDLQLGYTLMRIEKDAVLTPFNFSDIERQSDVRAHRFSFAYAVDQRVVLSLTGIVTQRMNGLLGAFGNTPPGSLNHPTTRLQMDTTFRF